MTAVADFFASGLFTRFDLTALMCEPTLRSVGVCRQYLGYAKDFGIRIAVVGYKVTDSDKPGLPARTRDMSACQRMWFDPLTAIQGVDQCGRAHVRYRCLNWVGIQQIRFCSGTCRQDGP